MSIGLNPLDYGIRRGEMGPIARLKKVSVTGSISPVSCAVGQNVEEFGVGQRVYGMGFQPVAGVAVGRCRLSKDYQRPYRPHCHLTKHPWCHSLL